MENIRLRNHSTSSTPLTTARLNLNLTYECYNSDLQKCAKVLCDFTSNAPKLLQSLLGLAYYRNRKDDGIAGSNLLRR